MRLCRILCAFVTGVRVYTFVQEKREADPDALAPAALIVHTIHYIRTIQYILTVHYKL